ncbi:N-acetyltransferase [Clostridioides sp. ZZV14-6154]|uniref:N-acetyltransferase n=1 Tax=unclassified Clostridioides TaxID=2635829 RepID=UPI001D11E33F|nr:N-acetyltransferase [Clostridioides sp. ZZV14-6154]MCC0728510.1 N-acetyltransferase [Clostridioides sp. ZZV14-6045]MCC0731931.1 N-acetyltransferase [Clostridioides sp. ZZV14-6048]MCC0735633.1 N-acetyltransferase [Clostridioides sp. ZZV14-6009]MCC0740588.1 N-acetyltransferase [Clostridioides sp. ZZV14-5902]
MIRKSNNKDIEKIMEIWEESTIKAHDFINKDYWKNSYNIVKNEYMPISETFVYDDGEEIKGFISIIDNEFIGALFISTNYQSLGIGSKLLDYVIKEYKNLSLAVYKDNKKAVVFYNKKGFNIVKEQVNEDSGFKEYLMEYSKQL